MDKKTVLLSQVIMTFIMATCMSGVMGLVTAGGPSRELLAAWPRLAAIAWPIAFVLTMVAWPASMALTSAILRPARSPEAAPGA